MSHKRLSHLEQYKIEGSNVEFIGSKIDHAVKYNSATTEPAWNGIGETQGLRIWRIEQFEVVPWPKNRYGSFHEGDSYIILHTYKSSPDARELSYDIFFWLGKDTTQDEAGTAAYKTVELDEFLKGAAIQHREVQGFESPSFLSLFPHLTILHGGASTGFHHVETEEKSLFRLLQITSSGGHGIIVREVDPTWQSLNENDVFVLDEGCDRHFGMVNEREGQPDVEVLAQTDSRSLLFIKTLGGDINSSIPTTLSAPHPSAAHSKNTRSKRLFRCSDSTGTLKLDLVKNGGVVLSDFRSEDVFLFDSGFQIYVWQGDGASRREKALWLKVAESYLQSLEDSWTTPVATVKEGREGPAFQSVLDG
ncbi:hypothetical protein B7494_g302 [Chlorociboria aeruginascens]|nr:hypothetical protein B7494_g302 [Chlorociboria aeruginascens]